MDRSKWEWQQSGNTMHAALIEGRRHRFCPGDTLTCVCGADVVLTLDDFPRHPSGPRRTCGACHDLLARS